MTIEKGHKYVFRYKKSNNDFTYVEGEVVNIISGKFNLIEIFNPQLNKTIICAENDLEIIQEKSMTLNE